MSIQISPRGVLAALFVLCAGPAAAADPVFCGYYAKTAVAQVQASGLSGCGFAGPRWLPQEAAHYAWCLTAPQPAASAEELARAGQLQGCTGQAWPHGSHRRCNVYAHVAAGQVQANQQAGCGFGGARWTTDFNAHYSWCTSVPTGVSDAEAGARMQQLAACAR
ncbi:MAG: hypothetical protein AAFW69_07235 [Pseudomonadota bacterium]